MATDEDRAVTFALDATDPDAASLSWALAPPAHGTVAVDGATATYTPAPDFAGHDLIEVVASDGEHSVRARVAVDVAAVPDQPRLRPDTFPATEDEPLYLAYEGMLANDLDPDGDRLRVIAVAPISGGSVALGDGEVVFTPAADYYGMARFAYTVTDGSHQVDSEVVLRLGGTNDTPVLTGDVAFTEEDQPIVLAPADLLRNDVDADGDSLMIDEVDDPIGGRAELLADGSVRFTPAPDFHGDAGFIYRAGDGKDEGEAWVTVEVGAIDDVPVPGRVALAALEDAPVVLPTSFLTNRGRDADGDPLLVVAVDQPLQGTVVLLGDRIRFVPDVDATGAAGFRYRLSDGAHETDGWVDITLAAVDDAPVALGQAFALAPGAAVSFKLTGHDVDSPVLEPEVIEPPAHGALASTLSGLRYTPEPGFAGEDELRFVIRAGGLTSAPARIAFAVAARETCGDGVVDPTEACDDGNAIDGDGCDHTCTASACGNGVLAPPIVTVAELRWLGATCNGSEAPIVLAIDGVDVLTVHGGDGACGCDEPVRSVAIVDPVVLEALGGPVELTVRFAGLDSHLSWAELRVGAAGATRSLPLYSAGPASGEPWPTELCPAPDEADVTATSAWQLGEQCDDGNQIAGDGCSPTCAAEP